MASLQDAVLGTDVRVQSDGALRVHNLPRKVTGAYKMAALTGTVAAAAGANGCWFAMRLDPSAGALAVLLETVRMQFTTIVAFTTSVTAGRRLELYRGSGAATGGGTDINPGDNSFQADTNYGFSEVFSGQGGSTRVATTATLTVVGITFEASPFGIMPLTHVGAAGGNFEKTWDFASTRDKPKLLRAGELLAVRNPVAMDAAGTWQLSVEVEWSEVDPAAVL